MTKSQQIEKQFNEFLSTMAGLLKRQPSAENLDHCDRFLRKINEMHARWSTLNGQAESILSEIMYDSISKMTNEDYKKIKHSSTITTEYVRGQYPEITAKSLEVKEMGRIIKSVGENYRTLISSYRQEREIAARQVRQTAPQN